MTVNGFVGVANEVYENYLLAHSAYALAFDATTRELRLHYNYRPWDGEVYTDGDSTLFLDNVSTFVFTQVGSILKLQLCVNRSDAEATATDNQYSFCKEKAIF